MMGRRAFMLVVKVVFISICASAVTACGSDHSIMRGAGKGGSEIASIGWFMIILSTVIGVGYLGLFAWAIRRGGRRKAWRSETSVVIAGGVFLPLAVIGILTYMTLTTLHGRDEPAAMTVQVIGRQFWWEVRYESGEAEEVVTANEIMIPVGEPVDFKLTTDDVIHSFWVPGLDGKMDMIPGRTNHLVVTADHEGTFRGQCAEFCGLQHAHMAFTVTAVSRRTFDDWLSREASPAATPDTDQQRRGLEAFMDLPCASCHTIRGTQAQGKRGPDLTHLGSRRSLGAETVANEHGNLGGWIANSQGVKPGNLMPPIPMTPDQLRDLTAYLGNLR